MERTSSSMEFAERASRDPIGQSLGLAAAPRLASRSLRSAQITVSRLSIGTDRIGLSAPVPAEDSFVLALYLTDVADHELRSRGKPVLRRGYSTNAMRIVNLQDEYAANIRCAHESLAFYIPRAALDDFTDDAGARRIGHLACEAGVVDPVVAGLGMSLCAAFETPANVNSLFVDHVCLALCAHLAQHYGGLRRLEPVDKGGLPPGLVDRAKAFMAAHCADETSLLDVARECGLSRGYFSKAFKTATGQTPHQWRQGYRIDKAKAMLRETGVEIAEIAMVCGFADQSHLTRVFAQHVGESPGNWRRVRRN